GEMWAQDAAAMYGYAASSASAGVLSPLTSPESTVNPAGQAGQAAASTSGTQAGLSELVSNLPNSVQGLASPLAGDGGLTGVINSTQNIGLWNSLETYTAAPGNVGVWLMFAGISAAAGLAKAHAAED